MIFSLRLFANINRISAIFFREKSLHNIPIFAKISVQNVAYEMKISCDNGPLSQKKQFITKIGAFHQKP